MMHSPNLSKGEECNSGIQERNPFKQSLVLENVLVVVVGGAVAVGVVAVGAVAVGGQT
jgi:hypothetical protein